MQLAEQRAVAAADLERARGDARPLVHTARSRGRPCRPRRARASARNATASTGLLGVGLLVEADERSGGSCTPVIIVIPMTEQADRRRCARRQRRSRRSSALALFVVWATDQAGYPLTHWAPWWADRAGAARRSRSCCVGLRDRRARRCRCASRLRRWRAYTALSFLSILWAAVPGDAWEGANRTLLYLLVFALFASWPQRGASAALLLDAWTLALIVLGGVHPAAHQRRGTIARSKASCPGGRLDYPTGYPNANAAQWLMAFWPALLLARSERLPWALRGLLAGGAVLLAEVALLSQSRGSLYATPVMLVLVFALVPRPGADVRRCSCRSRPASRRRRRRYCASATDLRGGQRDERKRAQRDRRELGRGCRRGSSWRSPRPSRHVGGFAPCRPGRALRTGASVRSRSSRSLVRRGRGASRGRQPGHPHRSTAGTASRAATPDGATGSRLPSGLGSNRYDFYRVALNEFVAHPLAGIGADNFQQQYLRPRSQQRDAPLPAQRRAAHARRDRA